jgi:hypothetical protein
MASLLKRNYPTAIASAIFARECAAGSDPAHNGAEREPRHGTTVPCVTGIVQTVSLRSGQRGVRTCALEKPALLGSRDVTLRHIFVRLQTTPDFIEACLRKGKDGPCVSMVQWVLSAEVIA